MWKVEYTREFENWWKNLSINEQKSIDVYIDLLEQYGVNLKFPYSSKIKNSKFDHMRELRIQHSGNPYRVLYAFDPRRKAILLIGGNKKGNDRWYEILIPIAEKLYDAHVKLLNSRSKK